MGESQASMKAMLSNQRANKNEQDKNTQIKELRQKIIAGEVEKQKMNDNLIELRSQLLSLREEYEADIETPRARL